MKPDEHVEAIRAKYALLHGPNSSAQQLSSVVAGPFRPGANQCLRVAQYAHRKSLIHECGTGQQRITEAGLTATKRTETDQRSTHQS